MSNLNLERIQVLIVDDSAFMRSLLSKVFHVLGARNIHKAEDGQEAIAALKSIADGRAKVGGTGGVDLIVSENFMEPLSGLMLLRWVRRSNESPDRFVPFFMISDAADREIVAEARDAGVTEFIAKPFSVNAVLTKIGSLIDRPRLFILSSNYFGPDRRRRVVPFEGDDRRRITEQEIKDVYADKIPSKSGRAAAKVWVFRLPNALKRKIGVGANAEPGTATIDSALIEAAEAEISEMEDDYADWVRESVADLARTHRRAVDRPEEAAEPYRAINKLARDLHGQGGMFGYPLVTEFGASLFACTEGIREISPKHLDLVKAHIDGIRLVINEKIRGDGGAIGRELLAGLAQAKQKYQGS